MLRFLCGLGLAMATLRGATIIGFDATSAYSISALTGAVTALGPGTGTAMSSGPTAGIILYSSGLNVYELNVATGEERLYACLGCSPGTVGDHAFDSGAGTLFALGTLFPLTPPLVPVTALLRLTDSGTPAPGIPNSTQVSYSIVGLLGLEGITAMEYVPSLGLLGTDGNALYRIDSTTGQASLFTHLAIVLPITGGIAPITGLAYDPDTGRLLGSAQGGLGAGGFGLPRLYNLGIQPGAQPTPFGVATYLNDSPPALTGIAAVNSIPEPASILLLTVGLSTLLLTSKRPAPPAPSRSSDAPCNPSR